MCECLLGKPKDYFIHLSYSSPGTTNTQILYQDFDGCFALTCANGRCRTSFCGWCLKDQGSDAHDHVARCEESRSAGVFAREELFILHQDEKKAANVKAFLETLEGDSVRSLVLAKLKKSVPEVVKIMMEK